jgi:hypothetical protein
MPGSGGMKNRRCRLAEMSAWSYVDLVAEEQKYTVVAVHPGFEVRRYDAHVVAEVMVEGSLEGAGNRAFRSLAGYIGGRNHTGRSVAMTAPVLQQAAGGRPLAMTAPVVQREDGRPGSYIVGFVMPAGETLETLPEPDDAGVMLRAVPVEFAAALRYSGRWTQAGYQERVARLQQAIADAGLPACGAATVGAVQPPVDAMVPAPQRGGCSHRCSVIPPNPEHEPHTARPVAERGSERVAADRGGPDPGGSHRVPRGRSAR